MPYSPQMHIIYYAQIFLSLVITLLFYCNYCTKRKGDESNVKIKLVSLCKVKKYILFLIKNMIRNPVVAKFVTTNIYEITEDTLVNY